MWLQEMSTASTAKRGIIVILTVALVGVAAFIYVIPRSEYRFVGSCLIAIGAINCVLHRAIAQRSLAWAESVGGPFAGFWIKAGKEGAQMLYLGIGLVLITAGLLAVLLALPT
jgi:hypothetical protein